MKKTSQTAADLAAQVVEQIRRQDRVFRVAKGALEVLWQARGGGALAYGLAAASALGNVADAAFPPKDPWDALDAEGLVLRRSNLSSFITSVLLRQPGGEELARDETERGLVWRDTEGTARVGVVAGSNPFVFLHPEGGHAMLATMLDGVWDAGRELTLVRSSVPDRSHDLNVVPMPEAGPYMGSPGPEWFADRLRRYPDGPRTVLLRGPSGVGKSVLARRTCALLGGPARRLLKVPSSVLPFCRPDELLDLLLVLRPTVLLLDDIGFSARFLDHHLALFETLRASNALVFVTMMTDGPETPARGAFHLPGMRPGRIDEVHYVGLPDEDQRAELLRFYAQRAWAGVPSAFEALLPELARRTEGLSGAYLASLVERLATHGLECWETELDQVLWASPPVPDDDGDDSADDDEKSDEKSDESTEA